MFLGTRWRHAGRWTCLVSAARGVERGSTATRQFCEVKEEGKKMKAGELYRTKAEQEEFYGIPFGKKQPEDQEDLMAKLRMKFNGPDELLTFYERYRGLFTKQGHEEVFKVFVKKLKAAFIVEKRRDGLKKNDIKIKIRERIMKDMVAKDYQNVLGSIENEPVLFKA